MYWVDIRVVRIVITLYNFLFHAEVYVFFFFSRTAFIYRYGTQDKQPLLPYTALDY